MIRIPVNTATRLGINVALLMAGLIAIWLAQSVFVPTLIALLLASVLGPAANWFHRVLKFPWMLACLTVILALVALILVIFFILFSSIPLMIQQLPSTESQWLDTYKHFRGRLAEGFPWELDPDMFPAEPESVSEISGFQNLTETGKEILKFFFTYVVSYVGNFLWQLILVLFILIFLLLEGRMLTRRVVEIFGPSEETQKKVGTVLSDVAHSIRTYLVWRTILNFGLAIIAGIIYQSCGLRFPWTCAILLALLNYIPYVGPLIAAAPPLLDALVNTSPLGALLIGVMYAVLITLEGWLVFPLLIGRSMELNATTVMLACLFWDLIWGPVGLFLAMPIMAGVKVICYHVPGWRPWANLMSSAHEGAPPPPPPPNLAPQESILTVPPNLSKAKA